ncbi:MAG TPA: HepT-like ribonuclease domain-containing protein [Longimicrobium sp.]|nr:HepT-like ribonuclease domain-containing protein [Longimicrobium sp.]
MQPDDRTAAHLWHMSDALSRLARYVEGRTRTDMDTAELLEDGVVRRLTVLGEAAGRVGEAFRQRHPEIPWSSIVGLRVTHRYDRVNLDEVWTVATEDAPRLLLQVQALLAELEGDPGSAVS